MTTFLGAEQIVERMPVARAIEALAAAFIQAEAVIAPPRTHLGVAGGDLLVMPAATQDDAGVKVVTVNPRNPDLGLPLIDAVYVLIDPDTLRCATILDGPALTAVRTSAVSALATRHLARADAHRLLLVGAGAQARAHLAAMQAVRPIEEVRVLGRAQDRASALVDQARRLGLAARLAEPGDVGWADLICTCTTSPTPVLDGAAISPGTHINAVGAYRPNCREVDDVLVARSRIAVEERSVALAEAGDLLLPIGAGVIGPNAILADLTELVTGAVTVRSTPDDITLFVSVGMAYEDLVVARAVVHAGPGHTPA